MAGHGHVLLIGVEEEPELDAAPDERAVIARVVRDVHGRDGAGHEELVTVLVDDEAHRLDVALVALSHVDADGVRADVRVDWLPAHDDALRVRLRDRVGRQSLELVGRAAFLARNAQLDLVSHRHLEPLIDDHVSRHALVQHRSRDEDGDHAEIQMHMAGNRLVRLRKKDGKAKTWGG